MDGSLGAEAWACVFEPLLVCPDPVTLGPAAQNELLVRDAHGSVVAAHVTVTWTASSPATATLGMGLMSMGPRACNCTAMIGHATGPSPLVLDVPRANASAPPGSVVHRFVYETTQESSPQAYAPPRRPTASTPKGSRACSRDDGTRGAGLRR